MVEEHSLGAFEEDRLTRGHVPADLRTDLAHHGRQPFDGGCQLLEGLVEVEGRCAEELDQLAVMLFHELAGFGGEPFGVAEQVGPQAATLGLVLVGGPDAAARGPDLAAASGTLTGAVQRTGGGQNQGGPRRQEDPAFGFDAFAREPVDLTDQEGRVDHHARREVAHHVIVDDARRHQVEGEAPVCEADGMAGIVAAVVADHHRVTRGQKVHDLALALVTPLTADDHHRAFRIQSDLRRRILS